MIARTMLNGELSDSDRIRIVHGIALLGVAMTVGAIVAGAIVCVVGDSYSTPQYFADLKVYLLAFGAILLALGQFTGRITHRRTTDPPEPEGTTLYREP